MFVVGLTGGIASGKSTISKLFESLQVPVIDTDIISHQLMQPGNKGYQQTVEHFGQQLLNLDNTINRHALRDIIFNTPQEKAWLEQMLHPLIREAAQNEIAQYSGADYVLLVVPLLFETNFQHLVDHVVAIDCPVDVQMHRLIQREQLKNPGQTEINTLLLKQIIESQLSNDERISVADSSLKNEKDQDRSEEVEKLHQKLIYLSKQPHQ